MFKCVKCNKVLTSAYNYKRHVNRITPCDILLQCTRCDKNFKSLYDLTAHANRKFPCKMTMDNISREEREKDRQLQLQLAEEKNKIKIQQININAEKILVRKEEIASRETLLKLKIQSDIDSRAAKSESRMLIVQESERLKLVRKKHTPSVVNNNVIVNNNNIYIDTVKENYHYVNLCFSDAQLFAEQMQAELYNEHAGTQKKRHMYFFDTFLNTPKLMQALIEYCYNNKHWRKKRTIFTIVATEKFYGMYIINGAKHVEEIDYDTKLREQFTAVVYKYYMEMQKYEPELSQFKDNAIRFKEMQIGAIAHSIKRIALIALEYKPLQITDAAIISDESSE